MPLPSPGPSSGRPTPLPPTAGPVTPPAGVAGAPVLDAPPGGETTGPGIVQDDGTVVRASLEAAVSGLVLEHLELQAPAEESPPELPDAVAAVLTGAALRGRPLPFAAAALTAEAATEGALPTSDDQGAASLVQTVLRPPDQEGQIQPGKGALGFGMRGRRHALVGRLQRKAVMLIRAALTLGDLRTALHKATLDRATPGTLRQLSAAIARMESLCGQLESAISLDGEALARLDAALDAEG
ncbi:MAG: hypothetical protein VKQ33_09975 [Candidatus Sericytochromatia bacterium]|nr:hypothetical protein [Candidatus Sericytochromatia bacterium]